MKTTIINLLPWREERRKKRQQEFILLLLLAAGLGAAIWFVWSSAVDGQIAHQGQRNQIIEGQIRELNQQIAEIDELEKTRNDLVERMKVIQELQGNRPSVVYVFDQLVRTLPEGVFYTEVTRQGSQFTLKGTADSHSHVSRLMRNLDASDWFKNATLVHIAAEREGERGNFVLRVSQSTPKAEEDAK
ncbi:PilN domain-containing protein [Isoalcanivorax beigongshangi]|uniref:PilN domain-containing protein n=1 Tax=Isoalcanivorax beigongshangi TaxID=3238810 RepID=A0ABV4AMR2_9GAMM